MAEGKVASLLFKVLTSCGQQNHYSTRETNFLTKSKREFASGPRRGSREPFGMRDLSSVAKTGLEPRTAHIHRARTVCQELP